jgi:hypothetical protein
LKEFFGGGDSIADQTLEEAQESQACLNAFEEVRQARANEYRRYSKPAT